MRGCVYQVLKTLVTAHHILWREYKAIGHGELGTQSTAVLHVGEPLRGNIYFYHPIDVLCTRIYLQS